MKTIIFFILCFSVFFHSCESLSKMLVTEDGRSLADIRNRVVYEYSIGDRGPAGGIIFHMSSDFGGRHFMEAAPVDLQSAQWGTLGERGKAAQLCNDYSINGFNDWFLPDSSDLHRMYTNLKRRNLGDFQNNFYWSSTQSSISSNMANALDFTITQFHELPSPYPKDRVYSVRAVRKFTIKNNEGQSVNVSAANTTSQEENTQLRGINTREPDTKVRFARKKLRYSYHPPNCCHNVLGRRK